MATIDRILTTHVGSLPRDEMVCDVIAQKEAGTLPSEALFDAVIEEAVESVVAKQIEAGIDIVSDGEFSKIGYANYIKDRLSGFSGKAERRALSLVV
jgi:5-methyltetrahydropteroyltriglutamate--homocysteine methyltransferase